MVLNTYKYHTPVLLKEVISYLITSKNGVYVDGTIGGGGHAEAILSKLEDDGKLIAIDVDQDAINEAQRLKLIYGDRITIVKENFANIEKIVTSYGLNQVQGILLDLGVSSFQINEANRGFSFQRNGELDMRMDNTQRIDAKYVINNYDKDRLMHIFFNYGEEKKSRRIADAIIEYRKHSNISTTGELSALIEKVARGKYYKKTLARIFQAIRIEVNNELENLRKALFDCINMLCPHGRLAVISYHSLEDRLVKQTFIQFAKDIDQSNINYSSDKLGRRKIKILTKKPITPSKEEIIENPRSRSAKLRVSEKLG